MALHGPNRNQGINRSPNIERYFPAGSGGDAVGNKPSDQIKFHHFYQNDFIISGEIPEWKSRYDKWIEWNRHLVEVVSTFQADPRFVDKAGQELLTLVDTIDKQRDDNAAMLKKYEALWERSPGVGDVESVIQPAPNKKALDYVLKVASDSNLGEFLKVATTPVPLAAVASVVPEAEKPQSPAPVQNPKPELDLYTAAPSPIAPPPPPQPIAQTPPPPPDPNLYHSKFLSLGAGFGNSFGNYRYFSPPAVGPRREAWVTEFDAAASYASPEISGESDLSMPTLQLQAILHPLAIFDATTSTGGSALSLLGNFQMIKEKLFAERAHFQMFQLGVGLNLEPLFQERWPVDLSIHGYIWEWGGEPLNRKYTRGGAPFVQAGICGGWNIDDNFTLQGCGDWREEGFISEFETAWGKSGDKVDFYILSATLLYHFRK